MTGTIRTLALGLTCTAMLTAHQAIALEMFAPSVAPSFASEEDAVGTSVATEPSSYVPQASDFVPGSAASVETYTTELPADETWLDNFSVFTGLNGAKQPQDLGINANLGGRVAFNSGFALSRDHNLGMQVGVGYDYSQNAVGVLKFIDDTRGREQLFTTVGFFQRRDSGWNWGLAYDVMKENYYDNFLLTQWRGRISYQWNPNNEFGVWGTVRDRQDDGTLAGFFPIHWRTINQANFFWRHTWETGPQTMLWAGIAGSHTKNVLLLPVYEPTGVTPVIGAMINVPLNDWLSLYGETNLILPGDSGTVDAFLGFAIYPGGSAKSAPYHRFAPMLPTASSPSFAVDLQ